MNIVLCDDNPVELEEIQKKVELYAAQTRQNIRVFPCRKSTVLSDELDQNHLADLYLLDIDMPKINGLQLAQKIHSIDRNLPVIFLTAYADYAPAAIKVQAFRYVSKADPGSGLTEALDSAIRTRERLCRYRSLVLKTEGACYCIPYDEICYAEKKGKHVEVHGPRLHREPRLHRAIHKHRRADDGRGGAAHQPKTSRSIQARLCGAMDDAGGGGQRERGGRA